MTFKTIFKTVLSHPNVHIENSAYLFGEHTFLSTLLLLLSLTFCDNVLNSNAEFILILCTLQLLLVRTAT